MSKSSSKPFKESLPEVELVASPGRSNSKLGVDSSGVSVQGFVESLDESGVVSVVDPEVTVESVSDNDEPSLFSFWSSEPVLSLRLTFFFGIY